jgi:hypothetical protein
MGLFVSALLCFVAILVDLQPTRFGVRMTFGSGLVAQLARIIHAARRDWLAKWSYILILKEI